MDRIMLVMILNAIIMVFIIVVNIVLINERRESRRVFQQYLDSNNKIIESLKKMQ